MNTNLFSHALNEWVRAIGLVHVITEEQQLTVANQSTFKTQSPDAIRAIVKPANAQEVCRVMEIANAYKISIYPISCGHNTGYGSQLPVTGPAVLCCLSRLNHIIEFNPHYGYVRLEPGVTFQQLFEYLAAHDSPYIMSATGASPQSSIIGNLLERGVGKGPHCNKAEHACDFDIVSATGELFNTSSIGGFSPQSARLQKSILGPSLEGLFTQSNFGIVTALTLWLRPIPKHLTLLELKLGDNTKFATLVDRLRTLIEDECVSPGFSLFNDLRGLVNKAQLPLEHVSHKKQHKSATIDHLKKQFNLASWSGNIVLNSINRTIAEEKRNYLIAALNTLVENIDVTMASKEQCVELIKTAKNQTHSKQELRILSHLGLNIGHDLNTCYWRKSINNQEKTTPEKDQCGIIWITASIPFSGREVVNVISLLQKITAEHEMELPITLQCISSRVLYLVVPLLFDFADADESQTAHACYQAMLNVLLQNNYLPYRLPITSMELVYNEETNLEQYLRKMKLAIDPNHILAPGRYECLEK